MDFDMAIKQIREWCLGQGMPHEKGGKQAETGEA
jgi:hypothetical protein